MSVPLKQRSTNTVKLVIFAISKGTSPGVALVGSNNQNNLKQQGKVGIKIGGPVLRKSIGWP